jgi:predicted Zn-dependent peptidase
MAAAVAKPVLSKGAFRGDVVAQEKENLKRRIEGLVNDLGAWAFERCLAAMCAEEPYAINEYGRVDDLPDLTPEELTRKHRDTLARWPIDFVALGDLEPEAVAKAFRRRLPLDRDGVKAPPAAVIRPAPARPREIVEKMAVEQGKLVIGCRTSTTWADDDIVALTFANGLLGAYPHSKLFANVRERDGLAYSVHSSVDPTKGLLFITAGIDPARYGRVVEVIRSQMKAVHDGDLTDEEIAKTRASLVSRARSRADSPSAMIDAFHEMAWLGRVIPEEELVRRTQAVRTEDVMRVMEKVSIDTIYLLAP